MNFTAYLAIACLCWGSSLYAEVTLAKIFADHAVLQRDQPLVIWGTANPAQTVRVKLGTARSECTSDDRGRFVAKLPAQPASLEPVTLHVETSGQSIERVDILLGDVWHASGQSNMAMTVGAVAKSLPEVKEQFTRGLPAIRFARIQAGPSTIPLEELIALVKWSPATPETVPEFSAAAFFFAKRIHEELDVPIGIIDSSRGGTPIEPYIPRSAFQGHPTLERELELGDKNDLEGIWRMTGGVRARDGNWLPGRLFHSRLAPIHRFAVRGCLWYQGESNCGKQEDPRDYQFKMRALIDGWRAELHRPQLPFYFVQLSGSGASANWPYLREQQRLCADIDNAGMVVTIDLEDPDIHPANKVDVGARLAGWALAKGYDRNVPYSGPQFSKARVEGNKIVVEFDFADSGLMIASKVGLQPPQETSNAHLQHFEIMNAEENWVTADATIADDQVIVKSLNVDRPVAVRYAYSVAPHGCNLFNRNGFPAGPFCSHPELLFIDPGLPKDESQDR